MNILDFIKKKFLPHKKEDLLYGVPKHKLSFEKFESFLRQAINNEFNKLQYTGSIPVVNCVNKTDNIKDIEVRYSRQTHAFFRLIYIDDNSTIIDMNNSYLCVNYDIIKLPSLVKIMLVNIQGMDSSVAVETIMTTIDLMCSMEYLSDKQEGS